jgi:hypothetical protein
VCGLRIVKLPLYSRPVFVLPNPCAGTGLSFACS